MRRLLVATLLIAACSSSGQTDETSTTSNTVPTTTMAIEETGTTAAAPFSISSSAFDDGAAIPADYTSVGEDISPELTITGVPTGAAAFVLIVDDPDAPTGVWDHWVEFNIPPEPASRTIYAVDARLDLPEGVDSTQVHAAMEDHVISSVELTGVFGR